MSGGRSNSPGVVDEVTVAVIGLFSWLLSVGCPKASATNEFGVATLDERPHALGTVFGGEQPRDVRAQVGDRCLLALDAGTVGGFQNHPDT